MEYVYCIECNELFENNEPNRHDICSECSADAELAFDKISASPVAFVVKDDLFTKNKWFIEFDNGRRANAIGYKTKKQAVELLEDAREAA
jgi:hypothetical protein